MGGNKCTLLVLVCGLLCLTFAPMPSRAERGYLIRQARSADELAIPVEGDSSADSSDTSALTAGGDLIQQLGVDGSHIRLKRQSGSGNSTTVIIHNHYSNDAWKEDHERTSRSRRRRRHNHKHSDSDSDSDSDFDYDRHRSNNRRHHNWNSRGRGGRGGYGGGYGR